MLEPFSLCLLLNPVHSKESSGQFKTIAIVGSGALGGYFGACLAHAGRDVRFLLRSDYESVMQGGLSVRREHADDFTLQNVQGFRSTEELGPCDLVIVAVKATQNDALPALIKPLLKDNTVVVTLQNGLGNVEFLQEHVGQARVLGGLVFMGINRVAAGKIENYSKKGGFLTLGEPHTSATPRVRAICDLLRTADIDCRPVDNLQWAIWRKLVWNVPFNGLSIAAGGITCDQIMDNPHLATFATGLMVEIQAGARALGLEIDDAFIAHQFPFTRPLGPYKPSSLVDYLEGREVEVEALWGEPLRRGTAAGAEMPRLQALYALLTELGKGPTAPR